MVERFLSEKPLITLVGAAVIAFAYGFLGASFALKDNNFDVIARTPPTEASDYPPADLTSGGQAPVLFVPPYMIVEECGLDALACYQQEYDRVVIINPCVLGPSLDIITYRQRPPRPPLEVRTRANEYTRQLCHELGHVNGWRHQEGPIVSRYPGGARYD